MWFLLSELSSFQTLVTAVSVVFPSFVVLMGFQEVKGHVHFSIFNEKFQPVLELELHIAFSEADPHNNILLINNFEAFMIHWTLF